MGGPLIFFSLLLIKLFCPVRQRETQIWFWLFRGRGGFRRTWSCWRCPRPAPCRGPGAQFNRLAKILAKMLTKTLQLKKKMSWIFYCNFLKGFSWGFSWDYWIGSLVEEAEHPPAHLLPAVLPSSVGRRPELFVVQWWREISRQQFMWLSLQ